MRRGENILFVFLLFVLLLISCKERAKDSGARHHFIIDVSQVNRDSEPVISLTELTDSVSFIKLETSDESLIGRISQILFMDSLLIIQDAQAASVLVFDTSGKFIRRIGSRGAGPGEYIQLTRVMLDADTRQIMIYDGQGRKMLYYDINGGFIKDIQNFSDDAFIVDIINLPNGNFLCYRHNFMRGVPHAEYSLWEVDAAGVFLRPLLPIMRHQPLFNNMDLSYLYFIDGGVGLSAIDANAIFHFREDTLSKLVSFDIRGDRSMEDVRRHVERRGNDGHYPSITVKGTTHEKGSLILTHWSGDVGIFHTFISKENNDIKIAIPNTLNSFYPFFVGFIVPSNDINSIILATSSDMIMFALNDERSSEVAKNKLKELTYGMSEAEIEDMNPIIQILHIKQ